MNSISSSKTAEVIELVRKIELRRDLLVSIYDEIQFEKESLLMGEAERFEGRDFFHHYKWNRKKRFAKDQNFRDNLPYVFTYMDENQAVDILFYIDDSIREEVLYSLNSSKRNSIENKLLAKRTKQSKLEELSSLYEANQ